MYYPYSIRRIQYFVSRDSSWICGWQSVFPMEQFNFWWLSSSQDSRELINYSPIFHLKSFLPDLSVGLADVYCYTIHI
jgi:hypothetical protein